MMPAELTEEQEAAAERLRRESTDRSGPVQPPKRPDENAPEGKAINELEERSW